VRYITGLAFAAVVAASGVACMSGSNNGNGLMPVLGTPPQKTEVFTGSIGVGGTMFFAFAVANVGDLTVTLTSAGPPATVVMRIGLGLGTTTSCQIQVTKDTAAGDVSTIAASQVSSASYCIGIGDIGNATGPVSFTITVVHT
jgi:hypothetical protein